MPKRPVLFAVLIFSFLLGTFSPNPANAQSSISAGQWTGYFERQGIATVTSADVTSTATGVMTGFLDLNVSNEGTVTGAISGIHAEMSAEATGFGVVLTCSWDMAFDVTGGQVSLNPAHLPVLDLQVNMTAYTGACDPPTDMSPGKVPSSMHMEALTFSGGKITGEKARFDTDMIEQLLQNMILAGAQMVITEYWELSHSGASVDMINPEYEQYFLEGIPFDNTYTALVNWYDNPAGKVVFELAGQVREVPGEGVASATFGLGGLPAGSNPLVVTAFTHDGQPSGSLSQDVVIVPLEAWAKKANFYVAETTFMPPNAIYRGAAQLPEQPLELPYLDVSAIPVIGGKWGVSPFQIQANLEATSGGGLSNEATAAGQTGLFLGDDSPVLEVTVHGNTVTNMTGNALLFDHGQVDFLLPPTPFEHKINLVTLVPGLTAVTQLPVFGDMFTALFNIASVGVGMNVSALGQVDIGPAADNSQLVFTKGEVTPVVGAQANFQINPFGLVWAGVGGGGGGAFTIEIAPTPGLKNCAINLDFVAWAGITGQAAETFKTSYPLAQCQQAAFKGQAGWAAFRQTAVRHPSGFQPSRQLSPGSAPAGQSSGRDGFEQLAGGLPPHAAFSLAYGPGDRLAFIYTGQATAPGGTGNENQGGEMTVRFYDGSGWGQPLDLDTGERPAFSPVTAFDRRGNLVIAWVQPGRTPESVEDMQREDFARTWEIAYTVVEPGSAGVVARGAVTEDEVMDFGPQLARAADGSLWLAWMHAPGTRLWGSTGEPNHLLAARWDGSAWSPAQVVSDQMVGTLGFQLAAFDAGRALLVADQDGDGDPQTIGDREVIAFEGAGSSWRAWPLSQNDLLDSYPLAGYTPAGEPVVVWQQGSAPVLLEGDLSAQAQPLVIEGAFQPDLARGSLVVGQMGELALLWSGFTPGGQGVWLAHRPGGASAWKPPQAILDGLAGTAGLAARLTSQGDVWLGLAETHAASEQVTLAEGQVIQISGVPESADAGVVPLLGLMQPLPPVQSQPASGAPENAAGAPSWLGLVLIVGVVCAAGVFLLIAAAIGIVVLRRRRSHPPAS